MAINATKKLPRIEATLYGDDNHWTGVGCISFVDFPAIESDYLALSATDKGKALTPSQVLLKANAVKFTETQGLKGYVTGPVLIPGKEILRYDEKTESYYNLVFSADTILQTMQRWASRNMQSNANAMHAEPVEKTTFFESTYIRSADHAASLGLDLPAGSWVVTAKVNDPDLLARIESKELRGFSIEGYFYYEPMAEELQALQGQGQDQGQHQHQDDTPERGEDHESWVMNMARKIPDFIKKFHASIRRGLGQKVGLAQYIISDGTTIDVDDESKAAKLVDAEGNLGESPQDGTYAVADSSDLLVIYGGVWVRTTTSNAAANVELALQKLVADGSDRATVEQTILDSTGLTADEWGTWMDGTYGCVDLAKIESIATAVGIEASTLQGLAEQDGCTFEAAETDASKAAMSKAACAAFKQATLRSASMQVALTRKTFEVKAASKAVPGKAGKVEAAGFMLDNNMVVYVSPYDGAAYIFDVDLLYTTDYLPVGDYVLSDGRKLSVMEYTEVFSEGTEYEWSYTYNVVDWANSELDAKDVLPWIKDQVGDTSAPDVAAVEAKHQAEMQAVQLAADAHRDSLVKVQTELAKAQVDLKALQASNTKLAAEIKTKDEMITKLGGQPGADAVPPKKVALEPGFFGEQMQKHLEHVKKLKAQPWQ
jgi:Putative phage serine protease XkdF